MADTKQVKKAKRFSLMKLFRQKKNKTSAPNADEELICSAGIENLEVNHNDVLVHTRLRDSDVSTDLDTDQPAIDERLPAAEDEEICDNLRNEHIEDLLSSHANVGDDIDDVNNRADQVLTSEHNALDADHRFEPHSCDQRRPEADLNENDHVIPDDLDPQMLFIYTHVFVTVTLVLFNAYVAVCYALCLLTLSKALRDEASKQLIKVHAYCSQLGVSLHAVIWVLLASFVGFSVAMLYLIVLLIYKLCMRVIEQVALAVAQLMASLIFVLTLGPLLALFGAAFTPASMLRQRRQQQLQHNAAAPTGSSTDMGRPAKYAKASFVFASFICVPARFSESLLCVFLFPLYLPLFFMRLRHTAVPSATDRNQQFLLSGIYERMFRRR